jgi:hypothetical protein
MTSGEDEVTAVSGPLTASLLVSFLGAPAGQQRAAFSTVYLDLPEARVFFAAVSENKKEVPALWGPAKIVHVDRRQRQKPFRRRSVRIGQV